MYGSNGVIWFCFILPGVWSFICYESVCVFSGISFVRIVGLTRAGFLLTPFISCVLNKLFCLEVSSVGN